MNQEPSHTALPCRLRTLCLVAVFCTPALALAKGVPAESSTPGKAGATELKALVTPASAPRVAPRQVAQGASKSAGDALALKLLMHRLVTGS
ncbi:hypothetical protein G3580_19020 [Nitrogeniibacter mangrovi]|uniref:Uncharacterized protein n=1 Tax=Nitrogeniibacter mangrovi TaxID=2016596 RepID=A0A6C1B6Y4_9RHOO|nr:hypothetical protein [Nitrogeniibacter mangrovi]QID19526.1 hypothetical protein G3580_19020 [Nitrogeniibacter mangrovi]